MRASAILCLSVCACSSNTAPLVDRFPTETATGCDSAATTATCFVGAAFAECPGSSKPAAYCSADDSDGCRWISNGCPTKPFVAPLTPDCSCTSGTCPSTKHSMAGFVLQYGTDPWTRARAMTVTASIDRNLKKPAAPVIDCTGSSVDCQGNANPCCKQLPGTPPEPVTIIANQSRPGTFITTLTVKGALAGWYLLIEADLAGANPAARVCRLAFSDALNCTPRPDYPDCATAGQLRLSADPKSTPLELIGLDVSARFKNGLAVTASL